MERELDGAFVDVGALRALYVEDTAQPAAGMNVWQPVSALHQFAVPSIQCVSSWEPVEKVAGFVELLGPVSRDVSFQKTLQLC